MNWKLNLTVLWFGQFLVMAGMTMVTPFLPLYLQELGIHEQHHVATWAGFIFAANFITAFVFQPIWGGLADRYGRKIMLLRSGFGMAVVMTLMGLATSPWQLLLLRMVNGTISGFLPSAVALISTNTPKERTGFAMGTIQSGGVAGSILGPFLGGLMAEWSGYRHIFYITGALLFVASILVWALVREKFDRQAAARKPKQSLIASFAELRHVPQLPSLYMVTLLIQFSTLITLPLMPLFVQELHGEGEMLAFYAGLVTSITGFSNMIASPLLGKWSDRFGAPRILAICLVGSALASVPQAFVHSIWQLMGVRFCLGLFLGGLIPAVNALIRQYTPSGMESRSYSFNSSSFSLGNMLGPICGGLLSGWMSIQHIFLFTSVLLLINAFWVKRTLLSGTRQRMED